MSEKDVVNFAILAKFNAVTTFSVYER